MNRLALPASRSRSVIRPAVARRNTPHRFSVAEYMSLETERRTELLGGVIFDVSPKNEPHAYAVSTLAAALIRGFTGTPNAVRIQDPLAVLGWHGNEAPEVDLAIVRAAEYAVTPSARDTLGFIEVSDSTYGGKYGDRRYKIPLYVNAGVPAWIVNIRLRQVEYYGCGADLELQHGIVSADGTDVEILGVSVPVASLFYKK
jgi:hypothetical protein